MMSSHDKMYLLAGEKFLDTPYSDGRLSLPEMHADLFPFPAADDVEEDYLYSLLA